MLAKQAPTTLERLEAQREALPAARFNEVLTVKAGDQRVTYKSRRFDPDLYRILAHAFAAPAAQPGNPGLPAPCRCTASSRCSA